jgi:hypothetical protein
MPQDTQTELLELSGQPSIGVGLVRYVDPDRFGTSGTTIWLAERFAVANGSVSECITKSTNLTYKISHHNFADELVATSGSVA